MELKSKTQVQALVEVMMWANSEEHGQPHYANSLERRDSADPSHGAQQWLPQESDMKKATKTTPKSIEEKCLAVLLLRAQAKKAYEEAGILEDALIEEMTPMEPYLLSNGMTVILRDNFVSGNLKHVSAYCRQFEVVSK